MGSIFSHVPWFSRWVLTTHFRIQDSVFVARTADRPRSPDLQRRRSVPYGAPPRRDPAQDIFHSSPTHRGATNVNREWVPSVDNPDLVHTPGPVQRGPSRGLIAPASFRNNEIYNTSAGDSSLPNVGGFTPPTDTEFSSRPQGVCYPFTSCPNLVSGESNFPRDGGPLIQTSPYPPYYAPRSVSTVEYARSNHFQLSRSGSQGPPLIVDQNHVRGEI